MVHVEMLGSLTGLRVLLQHVDKLPREKAFFQGPPPLMLSSVNPEDLTFLLLGSDPKTSQVTHQTDTSSYTSQEPSTYRLQVFLLLVFRSAGCWLPTAFTYGQWVPSVGLSSMNQFVADA